jgi:hypothetical protein
MTHPTLLDIKAAADEYWALWQQLLAEAPGLHQVIGAHSADALGWKVDGELAPLEASLAIYGLGDHLYCGPVYQERSIATLRKAQAIALGSLQHIKFLQRRLSRPSDTLGPDSLEFLLAHGTPKLGDIESAVGSAPVTCEVESNPATSWLSLRYSDHEFKLRDHSAWTVCAKEAQALLEQ